MYEAVPVAIDTSNPPPQTVATVLFDAVTALREDVEELTASVAGLSAPGEGENEPGRDQAPDGATQELFLTRLEQITFRLGQSLGQTSASLTDLNNETARVAAVGELAHESLAVARHIERTCAQIDQHLEELVRRLDAFGARLDRLIGPAAEGTNGDTPVATSPPAAVPPVT